MSDETTPNSMTIPGPGTVYVVAAAAFMGQSSAARVASLLNLSHRDWVWLPDSEALGVRVYRLMAAGELAALTATRWAGEAGDE